MDDENKNYYIHAGKQGGVPKTIVKTEISYDPPKLLLHMYTKKTNAEY